MKINNKWESITGVIISVVIISIIFLSLWQILEYNAKIDNNFLKQNYVEILENNTNKIISKLDLTPLNIWDKIYIYQDENNNIEFKNWAWFIDFWYINEHWKKVDKNSNWLVFFRECEIILKNSFKQINCTVQIK